MPLPEHRREAEAEEEADEFYDSYETLSVRATHSRESSVGDLVALEAHAAGAAPAAAPQEAAPAAAAEEGAAGRGAEPNHAAAPDSALDSAAAPAQQRSAHCPDPDWLASEGAPSLRVDADPATQRARAFQRKHVLSIQNSKTRCRSPAAAPLQPAPARPAGEEHLPVVANKGNGERARRAPSPYTCST